MRSIQKSTVKSKIPILLLSSIFGYICSTIRITKSVILLLSNLSQTVISASLLTYFFFIIKNYLLQSDLKLFTVFSNNIISETCCNIKNTDKIVEKIEILQNFFCQELIWIQIKQIKFANCRYAAAPKFKIDN